MVNKQFNFNVSFAGSKPFHINESTVISNHLILMYHKQKVNHFNSMNQATIENQE
jgi:hypothetical protein